MTRFLLRIIYTSILIIVVISCGLKYLFPDQHILCSLIVPSTNTTLNLSLCNKLLHDENLILGTSVAMRNISPENLEIKTNTPWKTFSGLGLNPWDIELIINHLDINYRSVIIPISIAGIERIQSPEKNRLKIHPLKITTFRDIIDKYKKLQLQAGQKGYCKVAMDGSALVEPNTNTLKTIKQHQCDTRDIDSFIQTFDSIANNRNLNLFIFLTPTCNRLTNASDHCIHSISNYKSLNETRNTHVFNYSQSIRDTLFFFDSHHMNRLGADSLSALIGSSISSLTQNALQQP